MRRFFLPIILVAIGAIGGMVFKRPEFQFSNQPPSFTDRQLQIYRNTLCRIIEEVKDPESFYVDEIVESDTFISIRFSPLDALQSGRDVRLGVTKAIKDGTVFFKFNKSYELLEKK